MPAAIVSVVATESDVLGGVTSVTLSDVAGSYGIRNKATGEVVTPAGTPLGNTSAGLWEYELDRDDGQIYECAIVITHTGGVLRLKQDLFAAPVPEEETASESDSESVTVRDVDIIVQPVERVFDESRGELLRLQISAENAVLMPSHIFTCQQRPDDAYNATDGPEDFLFIATPYDVTLYPIDQKDDEQVPGFFRRSSLDVRVPSTEIAKVVIDCIRQDVLGLIANYDRLDRLYPTARVAIDATGPRPISVDPVEDPADAAPSCPGVAVDDQLALYDEVAAF